MIGEEVGQEMTVAGGAAGGTAGTGTAGAAGVGPGLIRGNVLEIAPVTGHPGEIGRRTGIGEPSHVARVSAVYVGGLMLDLGACPGFWLAIQGKFAVEGTGNPERK